MTAMWSDGSASSRVASRVASMSRDEPSAHADRFENQKPAVIQFPLLLQGLVAVGPIV